MYQVILILNDLSYIKVCVIEEECASSDGNKTNWDNFSHILSMLACKLVPWRSYI